MAQSHYPNGFKNGVSIRGVPVLNTHPGKVFWVYNGTALQSGQRGGSDGNDGTYDSPFSTIDYAIGRCTASRGDVIMVKPGHAETLVASGAITLDVAGVNIVGLGTGNNRPVLTFTPAAASTNNFAWSAANCSVQNIICVAGTDAMTKPFNITGAGAWLDVEWQDGSSLIEAETVVLTSAAADNLTVKMVYRGFPAGDACVAPIKLVGCTDGRIEMDFYGKASTAVVNFITTLSSNIDVRGYMYNSGTTDGSKLVVDTVTGSLWYADIADGAAGAQFSGGSGAALASDDVTAVNTVLGSVSTTAATGAVTATDNLMAYMKQLVTQNGIELDTDTLGSVLYGAGGIATFPAAAAPANNVSLAEVMREIYNQQEKVVTTAAAVIAAGTATIFTVAGGPIEVLELFSVCVTTNDATATTLKYTADPTDGAATDLSIASASLANAAAGTTALCTGTFGAAPTISANGVVAAGTTKFLVTAGVIQAITAAGVTTGTWTHHLRYRPLARGVTVS
jgi:hypothetical protein